MKSSSRVRVILSMKIHEMGNIHRGMVYLNKHMIQQTNEEILTCEYILHAIIPTRDHLQALRMAVHYDVDFEPDNDTLNCEI